MTTTHQSTSWTEITGGEAAQPSSTNHSNHTSPDVLGPHKLGLLVVVAAAVTSIAAAIFIHLTGRAGMYGDDAAHLLHARRVFDSITPGFGQLGNYWPPLHHMLELPFVWIEPLYRSHWAGALPAMACYIGGIYGLYQLGMELVGDRRAGVLAAAAIGLNPFLLYLQASAMSEASVLLTFTWTTLWLVRFGRRGRFRDLVAAGLWSSAAVWTNWGGLLLPLYGTLVVVAACWRRGWPWRRIEVYALGYAIPAAYTTVLWLAWNFYLKHDPLHMLHYRQAVPYITTDVRLSTSRSGNLAFALIDYGAAVWHMLGPAVSILLGATILIAVARRRFIHPLAAAGCAGAIVILTIVLRGGVALGSPTFARLAGLTTFQAGSENIRYGVWIAPLAGACVALAAGRHRWRQALVGCALVGSLAWFLPGVGGVSLPQPAGQDVIAAKVREAYDGQGKILMSSVNGGDAIIWRSALHASVFLTEFNGGRFQIAAGNPRDNARWVLLAPGSSLYQSITPTRLRQQGYTRVWFHDAYNSKRFRYSLWRADSLEQTYRRDQHQPDRSRPS